MFIRLVCADVDKYMSRDKESAMMLDFPRMYVGYSVAWYWKRVYASFLATLSCCGCRSGLKVEWWSHPTVLLLSVNASILGYSVLCSSKPSDKLIVMIDAMNSNRFIEPLSLRFSGRRYLHAKPFSV